MTEIPALYQLMLTYRMICVQTVWNCEYHFFFWERLVDERKHAKLIIQHHAKRLCNMLQYWFSACGSNLIISADLMHYSASNVTSNRLFILSVSQRVTFNRKFCSCCICWHTSQMILCIYFEMSTCFKVFDNDCCSLTLTVNKSKWSPCIYLLPVSSRPCPNTNELGILLWNINFHEENLPKWGNHSVFNDVDKSCSSREFLTLQT